jgi:hypothetical protein
MERPIIIFVEGRKWSVKFELDVSKVKENKQKFSTWVPSHALEWRKERGLLGLWVSSSSWGLVSENPTMGTNLNKRKRNQIKKWQMKEICDLVDELSSV